MPNFLEKTALPCAEIIKNNGDYMKKLVLWIIFAILIINPSGLMLAQDDNYLKNMEKRFSKGNIECRPTINNLRLRKEPKLDSTKIKLLSQADRLIVKEIKEYAFIDGKYGRWIKIETEDKLSGWCFDAFLKTNFDKEDDNVPFIKMIKTFKENDIEYVIVSHPKSAYGSEFDNELFINNEFFLISRSIKTNTIIDTYNIINNTEQLDINIETMFNKKLLKITFAFDEYFTGYRFLEYDNGKIKNLFFQYFKNICEQDRTCVFLKNISTKKNKLYLTYEVVEYMGCPECGKGDVIIEYTYDNSLKITQIKSDVKKIEKSSKVEIIQYTKESFNEKLRYTFNKFNFLF